MLEVRPMISCKAFAIKRRGIVFMLLGIAVLLLSCTDTNCPTVCDECGENGISRPTPDSLLSFLAEAYEGRDIDAYSEALHDYYEFEFTPDIADSLGLPPDRSWWGKEMDVASTGNMFDDVHVNHIEFNLSQFDVRSDWQDCWREFISDDPPETTLIQGLCQNFEPDIKVYMEEPGQEERILWVHESILGIMVIPDPSSEGEWVVVRIVETKRDPLTSATEPSTWGGIKGMFK
jgi:hypothetical protein